jgi:hypothetical protein
MVYVYQSNKSPFLKKKSCAGVVRSQDVTQCQEEIKKNNNMVPSSTLTFKVSNAHLSEIRTK